MFNFLKKKKEPEQNIIVLHKDDTKYHIGDIVYAEKKVDAPLVDLPNKIVTTITGYMFDDRGITYKTEDYRDCINIEEYHGYISSYDYIIKRKIENI